METLGEEGLVWGRAGGMIQVFLQEGAHSAAPLAAERHWHGSPLRLKPHRFNATYGTAEAVV